METCHLRGSSGVPQGSLIGPILFVIYINDISLELSPDTILPLYADDAKCCRVISSQMDCEILKDGLHSITNWSDIWDMKFNIGKCKYLCITKKRNPIINTYHLDSNQISLYKEEKDLAGDHHHSQLGMARSRLNQIKYCQRDAMPHQKNLWKSP